MKLYAWRPQGHGELEFYVLADNEEEARQAVDDIIEKNKDSMDFNSKYWGTDYYELTVYDTLEVATNYND